MAAGKLDASQGERKPLTAGRLRELLEYDHQTGHFRWRPTLRKNSYKFKTVAGCPNERGYIKIRVEKRVYYGHRLAWLYVHGEWPTDVLDHVNGNRGDNRIHNLRLATQAQNLCNRCAQNNNQTGFKGVTRHHTGKFRATINGRHLGLFDTARLASDAYQIAAAELHGEFARSS